MRPKSRSRWRPPSGGAFDPTVGMRMAERGFTRNHRTGERCRPADRGRRRRQLSRRRRRSAAAHHHAATSAGARSRRGGQGPGDRPRRARAGAVRAFRDRCRRRSLSRRRERARRAVAGRDQASAADGSDPGHAARVRCVGVHLRRLRTAGAWRGWPSHRRSAHRSVERRGRERHRGRADRRCSPTRSARRRSCSACAMAWLCSTQHGVEGLIVTTSLEWHATRGMQRDYELRPAAAAGAVRGPAILRDAQGPADDPPGDPRRDRRAGRGRSAARAGPR